MYRPPFIVFLKKTKMRTLDQINFKDQRAVIRVDFNAPLNDKLEVADRTRIEAAQPTIQHILAAGGSCVLLSHLGRPKGKDPKLSLKNITNTVEEILGVPVSFSENCVGKQAEELVALAPSQTLIHSAARRH